MSTVAVKERPILFSGPMVRAILDGRKTQTRRVVKLKDSWDVGPNYAGECWPVRKRGNRLVRMPCPYGAVGDRLWVRETWSPCSTFDPSEETGAIYRAEPWRNGVEPSIKWTPSIHMPRWASRITLEITGVRVERLHDISNSDIVAEGFEATGAAQRMPDGSYAVAGRFEGTVSTLRQLFSMKWTEINGAGSWAANPWVWVIEFKRLPS